jgi:toxin ParE1/3/4
MANYKLSNTAKEDLIRIHQFEVQTFGMKQADKYFNDFFDAFDRIAKSPFSFEAVNYVKNGYRRCVSGSDSIYFKVVDGSIEVMTIIGYQDLEKL